MIAGERARDKIHEKDGRRRCRFVDPAERRRSRSVRGHRRRDASSLAQEARVPDGVSGSPPRRVQPRPREASAGTSAAATTLLKVLIDQGTPAAVKVRAAEAIFNHAVKAIEIEDIEARVKVLEESALNAVARR